MSEPGAASLADIGTSDTTSSVSSRLILVGLALAPFAWFVGLYFAWFHAFAVLAGIAFFASHRAKISPLAIIPAVYSAWYGLSIAINAAAAEPDRVMAAIYNLTYWLAGVALVLVASRMDWRVARTALTRMFTVVGLCLLGIAIFDQIAWHVFGYREIVLPTLVSLLLPIVRSSPLLTDSTTLTILVTDWLGDSRLPRLVGFAPYATATAAAIMFALPLLLGAPRPRRAQGRFVLMLAVIGCVVALYLANSRIVWLAGATGAFLAYATWRRALAPALFAVVATIFIALPFLPLVLDTVLESRSGSSHTRFELYMLQLDLIVRQQPLIGMGIKERVGQFAIPLGSHSTVLGALYKTGTIGLALILLMMATVTLYWFRAMHVVRQVEARRFLAQLGVAIIGMNFYLLTEDIDAPQMLCFLYFLVQGLMVAVMSDPLARTKPKPSAQRAEPHNADAGIPAT